MTAPDLPAAPPDPAQRISGIPDPAAPSLADPPRLGSEGDALVIRRRTRAMFVPRPEDSANIDVIVSRGILNARKDRKPETSRNRVIAGDLPEWEPMPPGESLVNRPGRR